MKLAALITVLLCGTAVTPVAVATQTADFSARLAELEQRRAAEPGDSAALDALAGSYASAGRYEDAIRITRELAALQPDQPGPRLRLAHLYAWSGNVEAALRELEAFGDPKPAAALELECNLLSWAGRSRDAARCFAKLAQTGGTTSAGAMAELGLARNLAWSGDAEGSIRAYRQRLAKEPADVVALLELARLFRYEERFPDAESTLANLLKYDPENVSARALQSEVLYWAGHRNHEALSLARRAVSLDPRSMEAHIALVYALRGTGDNRAANSVLRDLRGRVRSEGFDPRQPYAAGYTYLERTAPAVVGIGTALPFSTYNDSDGIHQSLRGVEVTLPVGNHRVWVKGFRYEASAPTESIFSFAGRRQALEVFSTGGAIRMAPGMNFDYSGGVARVRGGTTEAVYSGGISGSPVDRLFLKIDVARSMLPVTPRSIAMGVAVTRVQTLAEYHFGAGTAMAVSANRGFWNDGNKSAGGTAQLSHTFRPSPAFFLSMGPRANIESFSRDMRQVSGFFTPDWYDRYEGFATAGGDLGEVLSYEVRPAFGAQRVARNAAFKNTWDFGSSVILRLGRVVAISANYERRNYSLLGGTGYYQGAYFQLLIRTK